MFSHAAPIMIDLYSGRHVSRSTVESLVQNFVDFLRLINVGSEEITNFSNYQSDNFRYYNFGAC